MKEFRQIFRMGRGFVFRLPLPGHRFVSQEVYPTEEDAAFACDLFKRYISLSYCLSDATLILSLSPSRFKELASEVGINSALASDLLTAMPASCRDYLGDGGHEALTKYATAKSEAKGARFQ